MSVKSANITVRRDLTEYAFGCSQDFAKATSLAQTLSPVVPTGAASGQFNKFETTQQFKAYAKAIAERPIGGHASAITLLSDAADYSEKPYGLRVSVDNTELDRAGGVGSAGAILVEQSKVRTLQINCVVSFLSSVITAVKAAVTALAGKGAWKNANVDPLKEIDDAILSIYLATGIVPNNVTFDFGAWMVFKNNPNVTKRMPGADLALVNPERVSALLAVPGIKINIVTTAGLTGGGLANSSATVTSLLGGSVLIHYSSDLATPYDPSFCKTFAPTANLWTSVFTYPEMPHFTWYENDWSAQVQVVSALLCKRIDVTGANVVD